VRRVERRPAEQPRRQPPHDAGLGGVRVHELHPLAPQEATDRAHRRGVAMRVRVVAPQVHLGDAAAGGAQRTGGAEVRRADHDRLEAAGAEPERQLGHMLGDAAVRRLAHEGHAAHRGYSRCEVRTRALPPSTL
jgi:hypothetical protein